MNFNKYQILAQGTSNTKTKSDKITNVGLGTTLENIAKENIDKLKKRYPEGFKAERSICRKED